MATDGTGMHHYTDKILQDVKPRDLPIERPTCVIE